MVNQCKVMKQIFFGISNIWYVLHGIKSVLNFYNNYAYLIIIKIFIAIELNMDNTFTKTVKHIKIVYHNHKYHISILLSNNVDTFSGI